VAPIFDQIVLDSIIKDVTSPARAACFDDGLSPISVLVWYYPAVPNARNAPRCHHWVDLQIPLYVFVFGNVFDHVPFFGHLIVGRHSFGDGGFDVGSLRRDRTQALDVVRLQIKKFPQRGDKEADLVLVLQLAPEPPFEFVIDPHQQLRSGFRLAAATGRKTNRRRDAIAEATSERPFEAGRIPPSPQQAAW
jgi:hypothetical protein